MKTYLNYYSSNNIFHGSAMDVMGTRLDILLIEQNIQKAEMLWNLVLRILVTLDNLINKYNPNSEIFGINNSIEKRMAVSDDMWKLITGCKKYYDKTEKLFDITLVDFSSVKFYPVSSELELVSETSFDFGGIGKGYAVEKINDIFRNENVSDFFINFGNSSIFGYGRHPYGDCWKVSVTNPFNDSEILEEFKLHNEAMSTSGNTPSHTAHIIHALEQKNNDEKKMACVICENSMDAEVLSTSLMLADNRQTQRILQNFNVKFSHVYHLQEISQPN